MTTIDQDRQEEIQRNPEPALAEATISMAELRRMKSPHVYVVNTSDFEGTELRGEIALKYQTDTGKEARVKVPDTWIPYDISQFYDKENWVRDIGLTNLVNRGFLTIIDPEVAEIVLDTEDAKDELKRIRDAFRKLSGHEETVRKETNKSAAEARAKYKATDEVKRIKQDVQVEQSKVTPRIMSIMNNRGFEEIQKLAALKSSKASITEADITYIMTTCGRDMPKIKSWALDLRTNGH